MLRNGSVESNSSIEAHSPLSTIQQETCEVRCQLVVRVQRCLVKFNLSGEVMLSPPYGLQDIPGSDGCVNVSVSATDWRRSVKWRRASRTN